MMISVAVVYGIVYFLGYVSDKKQVDAMNRVLSERNLSKSEAREEDANE